MDRYCKTAIISHYGVGGSSLYLQQFIGAFEKKGFPVKFYFPDFNIIKIKDEMFAKSSLLEPSLAPKVLKRFKLLKYFSHFLKYLYNAVTIKLEKDCTIAHLLFPFYLSDYIMVTRFKRRGLKVILTVHEVLPHRHYLGGLIDKRLLYLLYSHADILIVHGQVLKESLKNNFSIEDDKIKVVQHGSFIVKESRLGKEEIKINYGIPQDKKILLFFGGIRENKGLDVLLDAYKGLNESFFLVIAGTSLFASEPPNELYEEIIKRYDLSNRLLWIKRRILNEEIPDLFSIADAVILPYRKTFNAQSGILNLAIGYEKPVIVTNVGGMGETVKNYNLGLIVEPENPDILRDKIVELFKSHNETYGFKRYKEENSWDRIVDKYINIYVKSFS